MALYDNGFGDFRRGRGGDNDEELVKCREYTMNYLIEKPNLKIVLRGSPSLSAAQTWR